MVELPRAVHRVISRGREYFYFQAGRGTKEPGPRIRLPDDPQSAEFWQAIRQAQGHTAIVPTDTVGAVIDAYLTSPAFGGLSYGTQKQYRQALKTARKAWNELPATGLRPVHVQAIMDGFADLPGKANTFLGTMRAMSAWARARDLTPHSLTEGVKPYPKLNGHKPWADAQIAAARKHLTGYVRRGVLLALYTGQRGSDMVRLGPTDIDEGGFRLRQQKTGKEVWCPIVPELAAEMATWERRPGPFVVQESGKPYRRELFSKHFREQADLIPELKDATIHGLRSTAVINLRRRGLTTGQIGDVTGMSLAMIERYCRFADKKTSGQAALLTLTRNSR